jgi:hypothetical protein
MNSYFIQRDCARLYSTAKMGQQEYDSEFVLNESKLSVANPERTFLTSLEKFASNLSRIFHASPSEGCIMTLSFSRMPSLCHLMYLTYAFFVPLLLVCMLFLEKHEVVGADVNLLIFQTESRHQFSRLVHVFRHFMRLQKDIADQFHEIIVAIIG